MTTPHSLNPYVGPRPFQAGETLHGREQEIYDLLDLLIAERIVLLYSPSGAGKTSLIQAGLLPVLREEGLTPLPAMRVSIEPPRELRQESLSKESHPEDGPNRYVLSALLSLEEGVPEDRQLPLADLASMTLAEYLEWRRPDAQTSGSRPVLIFDQFEEILTVDPTDHDAKHEFFQQVGTALRHPDRYALFSMREEFPARLDPYMRHLPTRFATRFRLELLSVESASEAVSVPAQQAGVPFHSDAVAKLINDLRLVRIQLPDGTSAEKPGLYVESVQLQVVCHRLWNHLPEKTTEIQIAHIHDIGDVTTALAGYYADQVAQTSAGSGIKEFAIREWVDEQLITEHNIRGQVLRGPEQSQGLPNKAIDMLVDAHLVRAENRRGATWYELAHDRLIEPVRSNNAAWFEQNLSPLQRQADLWDEQNRPNGLLFRDAMLTDGERWAQDNPEDVQPRELEFLNASREIRAQERRERLKNAIIRGLGVVAILVSIIAVLFFLQAEQQKTIATQKQKEAEIQREKAVLAQKISRSRELATQAIMLADTDSIVSLRLAEAAIAVYPTKLAKTALFRPLSNPVYTILEARNTWFNSAAFSPNGILAVTATEDGMVALFDVAASAKTREFKAHDAAIYHVAFSPDARRIVTASPDGTVRVWDAETFERLLFLDGHQKKRVLSAEFSPDGRHLVTASADHTALVWDAHAGTPLQVLQGHRDTVAYAEFSPDGSKITTASYDGTARVWDWETGTELYQLTQHRGRVHSSTFSADGNFLATASADRTIRVWQASNGEAVITLRGHKDKVWKARFFPDGEHLISASYDGTAMIWSIETGDELYHVTHQNTVWGADVTSKTGHILTASSDGTVKLWRSTSLPTFSGHTDEVKDGDFSPDGRRIVTASGDTSARVWDTATMQQLHQLTGHTLAVRSAVFSPDASQIATASDDTTARLWNAENGKELRRFEGHGAIVWSALFSPDGTQLVTASSDGTARMWNVDTGQEVRRLQGHGGHDVYRAVFSPDGTRIVTASYDTTAMIWEADTGRELHRLEGHGELIFNLSFSPDGTQLVTASDDGTVCVWKLLTGENMFCLEGHAAPVWEAVFSPDGDRIATTSADKTVRLWKAGTGEELFQLTGFYDAIQSLEFSPDGTMLLTTSGDRTATLWPSSWESVLRRLQGNELRTLSPEEQKKYGVGP